MAQGLVIVALNKRSPASLGLLASFRQHCKHPLRVEDNTSGVTAHRAYT